jgi:hypothetical protein
MERVEGVDEVVDVAVGTGGGEITVVGWDMINLY